MTTQAMNYIDAIEHLPSGSTLILPDVSWEEYEQLLADLGDSNTVRVSYDRGRLEIVSPSSSHEMYKALRIYNLSDKGYVEMPASRTFPILTSEPLSRFLEQSKTEGQSATLRSFRESLDS